MNSKDLEIILKLKSNLEHYRQRQECLTLSFYEMPAVLSLITDYLEIKGITVIKN